MKAQAATENLNGGQPSIPTPEFYPRESPVSRSPALSPLWNLLERSGLKPAWIETLRRYVQFGLVGASGVLVDMAALFVFADPRALHWNLSLSKALAAEIAIFSNFTWNELWTFRDLAQADLRWRGRLTRLGKFNVICLAGIALSVLFLDLQMSLTNLNMYADNLIAIAIVSLWNFGMNQKFGWNVRGRRL